MLTFPKDFLWGAATSAYQVEGGNVHADWWQWEKEAGKESSGAACSHFDLYRRDFDLAKNLHHNAHRFSVEWSRVVPEDWKFSDEAVEHYLQVVLVLKARHIEPVVTLHHFTNPAWFLRSGGWTDPRAVDHFLRYAELVVRALAPHVRIWITINEPNIYMTHAYMLGVWPPQEKSFRKMEAVKRHMIEAHLRAYRMIHAVYKEKGLSRPAVSIAQHMQAFVPCTPDRKNKVAAFLRHQWFNLGFIDPLIRRRALDFIGINYYSRQLVELKRWGFGNLAADVCQDNHHPVKRNSLGWDIYPEGLCDVLLKIKKYRLPVMILENGICTEDDELRWEYIRGHLASIHRAMEQGVRVTGYFYWALMDNFEWDKGFGPRFGLIGIDYKTQRRMIRESAFKFAGVCKTGVL